MEEPINLLSSMSPKVKGGKPVTRKVNGVLALKKHFRRSSILDKSVRTAPNDSLIIIDSTDESVVTLSTSSSDDSKVADKIPTIISDSGSNGSTSSSTSLQSNKAIKKVVKPRDKGDLESHTLKRIQTWVNEVNKENATFFKETAGGYLMLPSANPTLKDCATARYCEMFKKETKSGNFCCCSPECKAKQRLEQQFKSMSSGDNTFDVIIEGPGGTVMEIDKLTKSSLDRKFRRRLQQEIKSMSSTHVPFDVVVEDNGKMAMDIDTRRQSLLKGSGWSSASSSKTKRKGQAIDDCLIDQIMKTRNDRMKNGITVTFLKNMIDGSKSRGLEKINHEYLCKGFPARRVGVRSPRKDISPDPRKGKLPDSRKGKLSDPEKGTLSDSQKGKLHDSAKVKMPDTEKDKLADLEKGKPPDTEKDDDRRVGVPSPRKDILHDPRKGKLPDSQKGKLSDPEKGTLSDSQKGKLHDPDTVKMPDTEKDKLSDLEKGKPSDTEKDDDNSLIERIDGRISRIEMSSDSSGNELTITDTDDVTVKKQPSLTKKPQDTSKPSSEHEYANILDTVYGPIWRNKIDQILPLSETKPKTKTKIPPKPRLLHSEIKPKYLRLKKANTELDANLLRLVQETRFKAVRESPHIQRLRTLCDSDTDSESEKAGRRGVHKKLDFGTNDDERKEEVLIKKNIGDIEKKKATHEWRKPNDKPSSSSSNSNSDDDWCSDIVKKKIVPVKKAPNEPYSFLASLSASVPISKCEMSARIFRNNFKEYKTQLADKLFKLYNETIFDNVLPSDTLLEWNVRMRGTAGFCYCKKVTRRNGNIERSARIVLSSKVLDSPDRVRDTLVHEMCHAVTWIVNHVSDGHGSYWKAWAQKAMQTYPELPQIKRCHDYVVNTKYTYKCSGCGYSFGRHTKSLDLQRKRCGHCHGKLEVFLNKTNKKGETKTVVATPKKEPTGFSLFVKENYSKVKKPELKHGDVMKLLGQKFSELKVAKNN